MQNKRNFYIISAIGSAIKRKENRDGNGATSQLSERAISGYKSTITKHFARGKGYREVEIFQGLGVFEVIYLKRKRV